MARRNTPIERTAEEWIARLDHLAAKAAEEAVPGHRFPCFCDAGWPDLDCPAHFPENRFDAILARESAEAAPVLAAALKDFIVISEGETPCPMCRGAGHG